MVPPTPLIRLPPFDDSSSDNEGCGSQPWYPPMEEAGQEMRSASSSSTLSTSTLTGMNSALNGSQEQFRDEDSSDMINFGALRLHDREGLSSQSRYLFEQEMGSPTLSRHEAPPTQSQWLSQPSPPQAKHGKLRMSLTDLSSLTNSTSNLSHSHSQLFSQSVAEFPHSAHHVYSRHPHDQRPRQAQFCSHGHLNKLPSDPHLSDVYPPGLQRSVTAALSHVKEEIEEKRRGRPGRRHGGSPKQQQPRPRSSHTSGRSQPKPATQVPEERWALSVFGCH